MEGEVTDKDSAVEVARDYADEECVGQFGDATDVSRDDGVWVVEFETHTYSGAYRHRVKINRVGNVFSHERNQ